MGLNEIRSFFSQATSCVPNDQTSNPGKKAKRFVTELPLSPTGLDGTIRHLKSQAERSSGPEVSARLREKANRIKQAIDNEVIRKEKSLEDMRPDVFGLVSPGTSDEKPSASNEDRSSDQPTKAHSRRSIEVIHAETDKRNTLFSKKYEAITAESNQRGKKDRLEIKALEVCKKEAISAVYWGKSLKPILDTLPSNIRGSNLHVEINKQVHGSQNSENPKELKRLLDKCIATDTKDLKARSAAFQKQCEEDQKKLKKDFTKSKGIFKPRMAELLARSQITADKKSLQLHEKAAKLAIDDINKLKHQKGEVAALIDDLTARIERAKIGRSSVFKEGSILGGSAASRQRRNFDGK